MFFKVLAAMLAADAFDRHRRERQHERWRAERRPEEPVSAGGGPSRARPIASRRDDRSSPAPAAAPRGD